MYILLLILALAFNVQANARESAIEAVDTQNLRVCADPSNLPFSNEKGEGFENDIAEILGKNLGAGQYAVVRKAKCKINRKFYAIKTYNRM